MKPLQFFYSDITALAKDRAYTHINLDEMTIHQVTCFRTPFNLISNTHSHKKDLISNTKLRTLFLFPLIPFLF